VELFADISHKARQRQRLPATVSAVSVTGENKKKNCQRPCRSVTVSAAGVTNEDKKKNCCKPRRAKICLPQQEQTRKLPSFSEFENYSLIVESWNDNGGSDNVNIDAGGDVVNVEADDNSLNIDGSDDNLIVISTDHIVDVDARVDSVNVDASADQQQLQEDCSDRLCSNWNIKELSQAADDLSELACRQHNKRRSGGYVGLSASTQQCDSTSRTPAGFTTSTPHPQSVTRMSQKMLNKLADCTSQLELLDVSADAEIGTC